MPVPRIPGRFPQVTPYIRGVLKAATAAATRTVLGVGTGDSPTFAGLTIGNLTPRFTNARTTVAFDAGATSTPITITLPSGYTRYLVAGCAISGANGDLTAATAGLFTETGGAGTAIVAGASAITVSTASENTNNNGQAMTVINVNTNSWTHGTLYFHVTAAAPAGRTATVTLGIVVLS